MAALGAAVSGKVTGLRIGSVDCTRPDSSSLCQSAHVAAFPTIHLYSGGASHSHFMYTGERSVAALGAFLVRAENLGTDLVTAPDEAHAQLAGHDNNDKAEAATHTAARERLAALMAVPGDSEQVDPADPGPAMELIEALHRAGVTAPGDAARAKLPPAITIEGGGGVDDVNTDSVLSRPGACNVVGEILVPKVPGSLVFNIGANGGVSIDSSRVNLTHTIHTLYIGETRLSNYQQRRMSGAVSATDLDRLSNTRHIAEGIRASFAHYLAVVEHAFSFSTGHIVRTFAYTVQSSESTTTTTTQKENENTQKPPAVTFSYEVSPLSVHVVERRLPVWRLMVNCAAIIGGITAFLSVLDSLLHGVAAIAKKTG